MHVDLPAGQEPPRPGDVVSAVVSRATPHFLIASPAGDVLPVRRTRAGDAWDRTQALVLDPHAGSDHGSGQDHGGAPMGPVSIGLPTLRAGA